MSPLERLASAVAVAEAARPAPLPPCARCAASQRTCCQRAEILVTLGDVERIAAATGRQGFAERRAPADPAYLEPDPEDPSWLAFTVGADGTRRMLRRQANGDCSFLGESGCVLPGDARPLVCRLYPFEYTETGLTGVDGEYCPKPLFAGEGRDMAEVLGMDAAQARRWHATLYDELRAEARDGAR